MKYPTRWFILVLTLIIALSLATPAPGQKSNSRGIEVENDYEKGQVDGMRVILKKFTGDLLAPVSASQIFKTGDKVKVEFESNFDGYVYIVNVAPNGKTCILFPYGTESDNQIHARQRYTLPAKQSFRFNEEVGDEVLQVFMSRTPMKQFEDLMKTAAAQGSKKACFGQSAANAASELSNGKPPEAGINTSVGASLLPVAPSKASRSRGLEYVDSSKKENGTVVNITPAQGSTKLDKGDYAVYEIRLRHQ